MMNVLYTSSGRKSETNNQAKKREKLCCLFGLIFDFEDGGSMYLRNSCEFLLSNTFVVTAVRDSKIQLNVRTFLKEYTTRVLTT
jgi:hypothetical protein